MPGSNIDVDTLQADPEQLAAMAPATRDGIIEAFAQSLSDVFLAGIPFAVLALVAVWRLPEHRLRENRAVDDSPLESGGAIKATKRSYEQHRRALDALAGTMDDVVADKLASSLGISRPW